RAHTAALSLHDALPIWNRDQPFLETVDEIGHRGRLGMAPPAHHEPPDRGRGSVRLVWNDGDAFAPEFRDKRRIADPRGEQHHVEDRKSTRLNSSHQISS